MPLLAHGPIEDIYRLSPTQRGLLFHSVESPGSPMYVGRISCTVRGPLDVAAFAQAWQALVDRHAALRTSFQWQGLEEPVQIVHRAISAPSPTGSREAAANVALDVAPLLRLHLVGVCDREYRLTATFHHLILDGWSLSLLLQELFAQYDACRQQTPHRHAVPPPPRYRDFVEWSSRPPTENTRQFWIDRLAGISAPTPLPLSHTARARTGSSHTAVVRSIVPRDTCAQLHELARTHEVPLSVLMLGAWAILLSRLTGERDVVFGTVVSGRPAELPSVDRMVGVFMNTIPVRTHVDHSARVLTWLQEFHRAWLDVRPHENCPLSDIRRWSVVPPGTPLFESLAMFQNYPRPGSLAGQLRRLDLELDQIEEIEHTNFPLRLEILPGPELELVLTAESARFSDAAHERLSRCLQTIVSGLAADPWQRIRSLPLVSDADRRGVLDALCGPTVPLPDQGVYELFAQQAVRTPGRVAVRDDDLVLTYGELAWLAGRFAHTLAVHGVEPGRLVAIVAERNCAFLAAMLAIFKLGAAYLPLDPAHPPDRQLGVLELGRPDLVLLQAGLCPALEQALSGAAAGARPMLTFGELEAQAQLEPAVAAPTFRPRRGDLAYIVFTSGSTGKPKGATIEHGGMLNHLMAKIAVLELSSADRVAQTASQCFDISVWQFLAPLLVGGEVVVYAEAIARDAARLAARLDADAISVLEAVPTMLRLLVDLEPTLPDRRRFERLRWLVATGEQLPADTCAAWLHRYPQAPVVNAYGATECSDDFTHHVQRVPPASGEPHVSVGRPIANMQLCILDAHQQLLPAGAVGELYAAGAGLGPGYRGSPAITARTFVPDPFFAASGGRLYRTRDRIRMLEDGSLEFLGRLDHDVKFRGFLIEPDEIAALLRGQPGVHDAVALVREDRPGDQRLVAYLVADGSAMPASGALRRALAKNLPEYMLPSAFVTLDALPLDVNGKVDRRALPIPSYEDPSEREAFAAPSTATEATLAGIWSELLGVDRVGTRDNFFQLGGDSIRATRLVARVRAKFGIDLSFEAVFTNPRLAELAAVLDQSRDGDGDELPPLRPVPREARVASRSAV